MSSISIQEKQERGVVSLVESSEFSYVIKYNPQKSSWSGFPYRLFLYAPGGGLITQDNSGYKVGAQYGPDYTSFHSSKRAAKRAMRKTVKGFSKYLDSNPWTVVEEGTYAG